MKPRDLISGLVLILGITRSTHAAPAQCTPGSCNDNNVCTTDTCDPLQGCIYTPVNCDDGSVCTIDFCSQGGGPGVATMFIGHDTWQLEREYQKNGSFVQTWGLSSHVTGAAVDGGNLYVCIPNYGNNVIERRGPGNTNLGTITVYAGGQWIEDLSNYVSGYVLASTANGQIYRIDTSTGADLLLFSTGNNLAGVTYDGVNVWTTGGSTTNLVYKRTLSGTILTSFSTGQDANGIGYDPDDGTLWIGHPGGQVTHRSQAGALLGGFSTAAGGYVVDGLELYNVPLTPGCQHVAVDCNDNAYCTDDACDPMAGCTHPSHDCNDNNPCTDDACDPQNGCVHTNNTAPCEDSYLCSTGDTCSGGLCQPGTPITCNDNNFCTDDSCDDRFGCVFVNNTNFCNDGNACTIEEMCVNGVCQGGVPVACDDQNPCTADSCIPAQGCVYLPQPDGSTCNDNDPCTSGDACYGGTCHGAPLVCPAPDQCHLAGGCDPLTGGCTNPPAPNGTTCNDGNPCTAGDVCIDGACHGGAIVVPAETQNLAAAADKVTLSWTPGPDATSYDAVRGGGFPVGSSTAGESCFHDLIAPKLVDDTTPPAGLRFWYLIRPRNPCGPGPWGVQSNGTARVTASCP